MPEQIIELRDALARLAAEPEREARLWSGVVGPNGLLHCSLRRVVMDVVEGNVLSPVIFDCYKLTHDLGFEQAVVEYYKQRTTSDVTVDTLRLVRNARALLVTALTAGAISQLHGSDSLHAIRKLLLRTSGLIQPPVLAKQKRSNKPVRAYGRDPESKIHQLFDEIATETPGAFAARYWTLYWLQRHTGCEVGNSVELPVASVQPGTRNSMILRLRLARLEDRDEIASLELVEHPETALLPLGTELLQAMERAWRSIPNHSASWRLEAQPKAMDGDSLSGAAAVGFHKLFKQQAFLRSCLILARLDTDRGQIHPVGFQFEKLGQASKNGIRTAVIVKSNQPGFTLSLDQRAKLNSDNIKLIEISTFKEALDAASGFFPDVPGAVDQKLLGRYTQRVRLEKLEDGPVQCFLGDDEDRITYLLKKWPLLESQGDFRRAVWNQEMRNMYRLSSSSRAEECLVIMRDAGVDRAANSFVMVLEAPGYDTLEEKLAERNQYLWLTLQGQREAETRATLWTGLGRIAEGIETLHRQHIVHHNVTASCVFLLESVSDSWRLGGFEWSLRFGEQLPIGRPDGDWPVPPEVTDNEKAGISFEDDWYAFGMVAARCFYRIDGWKHLPSPELNAKVIELVESQPGPLSELECRLILRLISTSPSDRLNFGVEILRTIQDIIRSLLVTDISEDTGAPLVLIVNQKQSGTSNVVDEALEGGFLPEPDQPDASYNHQNIRHRRQLKSFLERDFRNGTVYAGRSSGEFLLVGENMTVVIAPFQDNVLRTAPSWDFAYVVRCSVLRDSRAKHEIGKVALRIDTLGDRDAQAPHRSWSEILPILTDRQRESAQLERFREFLRCTNQVELIMRQSEVFQYERIEGTTAPTTKTFEKIRIRPLTQEKDMWLLARNAGGMLEFLQRQIESRKRDSDKVLLSAERALRWRPRSPAEQWEITDLRPGNKGYLELQRRATADLPPAPRTGYLRGADFHGQVRLIRRRQEAIDRLKEHSYLLKALVQPNSVLLDTGQTELPHPPATGLDPVKIAVMKDILRVRPIYILQGPPGTGKTTLVAHLLAQILEEDPVSQILVTAQAHGAVDVLREKVDTEAFKKRRPPLSVRLGIEETSDPDHVATGTVEQKAAELLDDISKELGNREILSPLQKEWQSVIKELVRAAKTRDPYGPFTEFQELVRRGASIIFCTTSAGDLEELAKGNQLFDWVVLEEAGKVHGYDLALPLQAGHRWLLLGDHKQLEPYRIEDFRREIDDLDRVRDRLNDLSGEDRQLVDNEWLAQWKARPTDEKDAFKKYAKEWLQPFKPIFFMAQGFKGLTTDQPGAAAGTLTAQYRMHPAIGNLVSETFYGGLLSNETSEEEMDHKFQEPYSIDGKALVWLNTPWCKNAPAFAEHGDPKYTNEKEIEEIKLFLERLRFRERPPKVRYVAVLSPYNQQVRKLNAVLTDVTLPAGLEFRESLRARRAQEGPRRAHTVDSFQGNQADVVIISLVRNNTHRPWSGGPRGNEPDPLGFLSDEKRLNVLVSRAERLLVLVGSWDFFTEQLIGLSSEAEATTPLLKWKVMMNHFQSKNAVIVPYRGLSGGGRK